MKKYLIIVAGGKGTRMGGSLPKQFMTVAGWPLLMHTLQCFHRVLPDVECVLVLPEDHIVYWADLRGRFKFELPHTVIEGGNTRFRSVKNGLDAIVGNEGLVSIHDGVRPFPSAQLINEAYATAEKTGSAIPVLSPTESIREVDGNESRIVDRNRYRMVQTPQTFRLALLKEAYKQPYNELFTDDASVVEASGVKVTLIDGNRENIKITHRSDLLWAEAYLKTCLNRK